MIREVHTALSTSDMSLGIKGDYYLLVDWDKDDK